ncbi:MAG: site-specific DNA-methyltransferase [Prevotella sp.]|nr:site-specific DNA-methyltransferase [Prevotella sp.]
MKPDKLETKSLDNATINLEALYQIAPSCFTEVKDAETGKLRHVINFDTLRQLLGDDAVEDADEMYQFTWPGKQDARREAARPINKTLRPVVEDSVDWDNTQNLYIEGDNLDVLKLLQKSYLGKVKMIYIDPPYNTGNDFVYNDNFTVSKDDYDLFSGDVDELGNRYRRNTDTNGRFHSDWCSMIYPRLMVARSLLTDDGVIFISIDDNEQRNLKNICDEIFGEGNFVAQVIWEQGRKSMAAQVAVNHEYCYIYCKNKIVNVSFDKTHPNNNWQVKKRGLDLIYKTYETLKMQYGNNCEKIENGLKKFFDELPDDNPAKAHSHYRRVDQYKGIYFQGDISQGTGQGGRFDIIHPITQKPCKVPAGGWRFSENKLPELLANHRIVFGKDESTIPCLKRYLKETEYEVFSSVFYKDGRGASKRIEKLLGGKYFDYPKDENIIKTFVSLVTSYTSSNDIVLDFFSGSATTAHAVMQLNAEDEGNRKFILVQLPEETPEDSEARKAGYKYIPEIAKERIRRAGKKIKSDSPLTTQNLDTGFRVFRLADSNFIEDKKAPKEYTQDELDAFLDNVKSDRTDLDLLFGAMLNWGVQLSLPMTTEIIDNKKIYFVNNGDLAACFADNITENILKAITAKQPLRILFRDRCFTHDDAKINVFETLKQLLNWSEEEAMKNIRVI